TEVDRVMAIAKVAGFYWLAAYDFAFEGLQRRNGVYGLPYDAGQKDDVDQWMLAVAYQDSPEVEKRKLSVGSATIKGGLMAVHRSQLLSAVSATGTLQDDNGSLTTFIRRGLSLYTLDAWGEFRYRGLRLSAETAFRGGSIENIQSSAPSTNASLD